MTTTATTATNSPATFRLGGKTRKAVLMTHIVSAGAWIGIDVVLAVFVFTALATDDPGTAALAYQGLALFAVWPLFTSGVVCLLSGVVLGLGSKYGLVRYWWVAVKLVLNLVLATLVLFLLRPGVGEAASYGRRLAGGQPGDTDVSTMVFPPIVSGTALLVAFTLSVFKPWGRIRGGRNATVSPAGSGTRRRHPT